MSEIAPTIFEKVLPAVIGLFGVLIGSLLTIYKEFIFDRRNTAKDAKYLAVKVVGALDRFVFACAEVAADDGLNQGQRNADVYLSVQVMTPEFLPEELKVEWRSISSDLMYEILDLPYKAEITKFIIDGAAENSIAPDYEDFFEERRLQYANIGLLAAEIANKLRAEALLPNRSISYWDPVESMHQCREKIEQIRTQRAAKWE